MRALIKPDSVELDEQGNDTLYLALDNGQRFMECSLSYNSESEKWELLANDSVIVSF